MDGPALEGIFGFTDEQLAANRSGVLSPGQRTQLQTFGVMGVLVGGLLLLAGALGALLAADIPIVSPAALAVAAFGLFLTWKGFANLADGAGGTVAFLTGPLTTHTAKSRRGLLYYADIGPISKQITRDVFFRLSQQAQSCHLYYSPGARHLLSIEPATASEPRPDHPFGPDSAHAWDRVRWSWVLFTIGALGVLIAAYTVATAHPAQTYTVHGTVSNYEVRHGKNSTYRDLFLDGDSSSYSMQSEDSYDPPASDFALLIGRPVVLYVNQGTHDVLAIDDGQQLHKADWYEHPEHQTAFEAGTGASTGVLSVLAFLAGLIVLLVGRWRLRGAAPAAADRYTPPTVQPVQSHLPASLLLGALVAVVALGLAIALNSVH